MDRARPTSIAAGGTGGHIFPGIALAREIASRRPGSARRLRRDRGEGLETRLVPGGRIPGSRPCTASGFAGKGLGARIVCARTPARSAFREARRLLRRLAPRAVAGVGGYASVPVILAARSLGDSDARSTSRTRCPGIANRFLSRLATRSAVGCEAARRAAARGVRRHRQSGAPRVLRGAAARSAREVAPACSSSAGARASAAIEPRDDRGRAAARRRRPRGPPPDGREVARDGARRRYGRLPAGWRLEAFLPRNSTRRCPGATWPSAARAR